MIKGVNLGNWLVLEKWMSPGLFCWDQSRRRNATVLSAGPRSQTRMNRPGSDGGQFFLDPNPGGVGLLGSVELGLVETVSRLGQGIVIGISDCPDRGAGTDLLETRRCSEPPASACR